MFRKFLNKRRFVKARNSAGENEMVCGTIDPQGRPVYFVMPRDSSDIDVRDEAFRVVHGRDMSSIENTLLGIAERT